MTNPEQIARPLIHLPIKATQEVVVIAVGEWNDRQAFRIRRLHFADLVPSKIFRRSGNLGTTTDPFARGDAGRHALHVASELSELTSDVRRRSAVCKCWASPDNPCRGPANASGTPITALCSIAR